MFGLLDQLRALDQPIRVGIAGVGSIGRGLLHQTQITPGIRCVAIADIKIERAVAAAERFGFDYRITDTPDAMIDTIRNGRLCLCEDGEMVAACESMDVFLEATSSVVAGGRHGLTALNAGNDVVMMNYEADLMFGFHLMTVARGKNLVYTVCDGDEPAAIKRLVEEMTFMGFQLVMGGNIKGFLNRYANPTTIKPEADKRNLDARMCASFTDGTKLCVEMAVLANGLGLSTPVPGMLGPRVADIHDVFDHFDFETLWDRKTGLVDYVLGARPTGGVFAIGYTDDAYQRDTLAWFPPRMGPGPFYLFYRPYHLGHFEGMATVAEAVINRRPTLQPRYGFRTNVYARAKRDLAAGEILDGVGGYTCYGLIENCADHKTDAGLPVCLADQARLKRAIRKDESIRMTDIYCEPGHPGFAMYHTSFALADAMTNG
jgi:predicted homoserine dehydrogenase-like protein